MDTMKYYSIDDGEITNDDKAFVEYYTLESTSGGYIDSDGSGDHEGEVFVEYYDRWIDEEDYDLVYCDGNDEYRFSIDCFYSEFYELTYTNEHAENYMTKCDYALDMSDAYRDSDDCVKIERYDVYATDDYLASDESIFVWSDEDDDYVKKEDIKE